MKIGIYTIAKQEAKHVARFMEALKDADGVFITDTGSTDDTKGLLRAAGAHVQEVEVNPWRLDVARNISLDFVDHEFDVAVCVDLDEVLQAGWRAEIEKEWKDGRTKLYHPLIASFCSDGVTPDNKFFGERIHARHGYRWQHIAHEQTYWRGSGEQKLGTCGMVLEHRPDNSKSRAQYLEMLSRMAAEETQSNRAAYYYGRELFFRKMYAEAEAEFVRMLTLKSATWHEERASAMRYIAGMKAEQGKGMEQIQWLMRACAEALGHREPWLDFSFACWVNRDLHGCYYAAKKALEITMRSQTPHSSRYYWGAAANDLLACSAWDLGRHIEAFEHARKAWELEPADVRLKKNMDVFGEKAASILRSNLAQVSMADTKKE